MTFEEFKQKMQTNRDFLDFMLGGGDPYPAVFTRVMNEEHWGEYELDKLDEFLDRWGSQPIKPLGAEFWRLGMKKKAQQEFPFEAKSLNSLANLIKRNQWKPTNEDVQAVANFVVDKVREGERPQHFFQVLYTTGNKEFGDEVFSWLADVAPDLNLAWSDVVYESIAIRKSIVASLTKRWLGGKYKKAELNGRKEILDVLIRVWKV